MKTIVAHGKYTVSFNTEIGDYEVGDSWMNTVDYAGDDMFELAAEVIADDAHFPMVFERVDGECGVVGTFRGATANWDDFIVAVMVDGEF